MIFITMIKKDLTQMMEGRFNYWNELSKKHFPKTSDLTLIILKGHLLLEQMLTSIISHYCSSSDHIIKAQLRFPQKISLVRALLSTPTSKDAWETLALINTIRNDLSHNLEPPKLKEHLAAAKKLALQIENSKAINSHLSFNTEIDVIVYLVRYAESYLVALNNFILAMEPKN